jgi:hypothetical protein
VKSLHFNKCEKRFISGNVEYLFYLSSMLFLVFLVFVLNSIELFFAKYCVIRKGNTMNNTSNLVTLIRLIGRPPFTIPDKLCINSLHKVSHFIAGIYQGDSPRTDDYDIQRRLKQFN